MKTIGLIMLGKMLSRMSKLLNMGNGSTWPGHIALLVNRNFIQEILKNSHTKFILVAGTNGKTTTSRMITGILREGGKSVFQNESGANLINGVASSLLLNTNIFGKLMKNYGVFEVDENSLAGILGVITPTSIVLLNLFRDQLDRYGEIDTIAKKWGKCLSPLPPSTNVILNADDAQIAYLGDKLSTRTKYFGLDKEPSRKNLQHASDSIYCPRCYNRLTYKTIFFSHLGVWHCPKCGLKHPKSEKFNISYPLPGTYNKYNTLAAVLVAYAEGISKKTVSDALEKVTPAFGRQETILFNGKNLRLFLAKNPAGFNQTLETIVNLGAKYILIVLNDQIPDGRDVSWIWDVDFEEYYSNFTSITISGDRAFDMALRIQYASENEKLDDKISVQPSLRNAIHDAHYSVGDNMELFVLATYSAMLETRRLLTGKEIL